MIDRCTWHPVVRWLLFLPAGIAAMCLARAIVILAQYFNGESRYWGLCLAVAVESWAFLAASLWFLPRGRRAFILLFSFLYVGLAGVALYLDLLGSAHPHWSSAALMFISVASGIIAGWHYYRRESEALPKADQSMQTAHEPNA
jgi:hypothetical protein